MAITVNSLMDRQQRRILEIINKRIEIQAGIISPVWRNLVITSQGVGDSAQYGRNLIMYKTYMGGYTGKFEAGAVYNDIDLYGGPTSPLGPKMHMKAQLNSPFRALGDIGLPQAYPNPVDGLAPTVFQLAIGMRAITSNLMMLLSEKTLEATPAVIGQIIAPQLTGHADHGAHLLANYWYLSQNDDYKIAGIAASPAPAVAQIGSTQAWRITIGLDNNATYRLARGMPVDMYDTGGTAGIRQNDTAAAAASQNPTTRIPLVVESVSHLKGIVTLVTTVNPAAAAAAGWSTGGITIAAGMILMHANSKSGLAPFSTANTFTGIAGVNSWLKGGDSSGSTKTNANTLLGTGESDANFYINVNDTPEGFASFTKSLGAVLTEFDLKRYLARCDAAWGPSGHQLDCLVAPDGVWMAYAYQKIGMERIDRTARLSSLQYEGQVEGFEMTFNGKTYSGYIDNAVESGTLYGIKKGNDNWKRYTPPSPVGVTRNGEMIPQLPFEFVGKALTGVSDMMPIYKADGAITLPTEAVQMPGRIRMQLVPEDPRMMKVTSITEDRVTAD